MESQVIDLKRHHQDGRQLKPSFWNTPLEAPLPMPPQEQDLCRLPTRVAAFIGSAAGVVKALAYTKRMASNGSQQCRHGPEDLQ
jgi:hypothetical protein